MGQIVSAAAKPKRCNLSKLSQLGTPAAGEYILVSSDNSMNAAGQGNFDCYIKGDGTKAATALELKPIANELTPVLEVLPYDRGEETITITPSSSDAGWNKYVSKSTGNIVGGSGYYVSNPINLKKGDRLQATLKSNGTGILAKYIDPTHCENIIVTDKSGVYQYTIDYTATEDISVVLCGTTTTVTGYTKTSSALAEVANKSDVTTLQNTMSQDVVPVVSKFPDTTLHEERSATSSGSVNCSFSVDINAGDIVKVSALGKNGLATQYNTISVYKDSVSSANKILDLNITTGAEKTFTAEEPITTLLFYLSGSFITTDGDIDMYVTTEGYTKKIDKINGLAVETSELQRDVNGVHEETETTATTQEMLSRHVLISYKEGDVLSFRASGNANFRGNTLLVYHNYAVDELIGEITYNDGKYYNFVASKDGNDICFYKAAMFVDGGGDVTLEVIRQGKVGVIESQLEEIAGGSGDFEITECPTIYARTLNNANSSIGNDVQSFAQKIYPEGFITSHNDVLSLEGGRELPVRTAYDGADVTKSVGVMKGLSKKTTSVQVKSVQASVAVGKKAMVLCIGESTTAAVVRNPYKNTIDYCYGFPSSMQHFADIDNINLGNINFKTLGTKHWFAEQTNPNGKYTYNGVEYQARSFMEGWGGQTIFWMLNLAGPIGGLSNGALLWQMLGLKTKTPLSASSYNTSEEEYTGSDEQKTLLTQTPFQKYKIDPSADVYEAIKGWAASTDYDYPSFPYTDTYTGTSAQIAAINQWGASLANDPINPFYDFSKVSGGGSVAFSLDKYLQRYRTLDDNGVRLSGSAGQSVTGSDGNTYTIGTKVTDVNAWDVCTPTHVIFNMGINDAAVNTISNTFEEIKTMMAQFNVPTAYFFTRIPGTCEPAKWADKVVTRSIYGTTLLNAQSELLTTIKTWFDAQADKYLLPVFHIQPPCSVLFNYVEGDFIGNDGAQILNASTYNIHPSYDAYRAIGWQCLQWVYYTLSVSE